MPKKSTAAKRKTSTKTPAKKTAAKKGPANKKATNVKKPAAKKSGGQRGGFHREINEETGFVVGTDQDAIALALLEGGESRAAISERLEKELDTETRNGTPKQITNMISGVLNKMIARGFIVESSFQVTPPTPASKRAATRAANAAKSKPAPAKKSTSKSAPAKKTASKKPAAKKTTAKKGSVAKGKRK